LDTGCDYNEICRAEQCGLDPMSRQSEKFPNWPK
jgi:hypothetical protein